MMTDESTNKRRGAAAAGIVAVVVLIWTGVEEIGHIASLVWIIEMAKAWLPSATSALGPKPSVGIGTVAALVALWFLRRFWSEVPNSLRSAGALVVIAAAVLASYAGLHLGHHSTFSDVAGASAPSKSQTHKTTTGAPHRSASHAPLHRSTSSKPIAPSTHSSDSPSVSSTVSHAEEAGRPQPIRSTSSQPAQHTHLSVPAVPVVAAESSSDPSSPAKAQPVVEAESPKPQGAIVEGSSN